MQTNHPVPFGADPGLAPHEIVAVGFLASYPEKTREGYALSLRQWFGWCGERGMPPLSAGRSHIDVWARELEERKGLKASTVVNKLNAVCGFYRHAKMDGYIENNPAEYLKKPHVPRRSTTNALTRREFFAVWDLAKQSPHTDDLLLIGILGLLGLRVGEACALNIEDFGEKNGYLTIMVTREKRNRSGNNPLPMMLVAPIQRRIKYDQTGPLLRMRGGQRMDQKAANRIIHRLCKQAGITKRITPHSLRHTFVTMAHDAGVNPRIIQHSLGYADLRMVSYYDHFTEDPAKHATHAVAAYLELGG